MSEELKEQNYVTVIDREIVGDADRIGGKYFFRTLGIEFSINILEDDSLAVIAGKMRDVLAASRELTNRCLVSGSKNTVILIPRTDEAKRFGNEAAQISKLY